MDYVKNIVFHYPNDPDNGVALNFEEEFPILEEDGSVHILITDEVFKGFCDYYNNRVVEEKIEEE